MTAASARFPVYRPASGRLPVTRPGATTLFCLPHAGAGASAYWDWVPLLAPEVQVVPIQLPGRESRYKEPALRSAFELTADLIGPLTERVAGRGADRAAEQAGPGFAIFGHSMGGLLAYELTRALTIKGMPPKHLFISGLRAPHLPPSHPPVHLLPDPELLAVMEELGGTSPEVLAHPELVQLMLPVIRADFEVCDTYAHLHQGRLPVPITVLGGLADPSVSVSEMRAWRDLTSAGFEAEFYPGDHFYLHTSEAEVIAALLSRLAPTPALAASAS